MNEIDREARAIEFYDVLSSFDFMSSTPTLFNSGTQRSQLSSCYLTTVPDDLDGIYEAIKENALLAKYAGGLGNDWTPVRALGSHIKGTNGKSQGVVPFLKVVNDTAVAVNQGGKRKGAVCAYLETWHLDIEEFLELRKNTGDDRRRTHDMNTANWIPDLFMKRVMEERRVDAVLAVRRAATCTTSSARRSKRPTSRYEEKAARGELKLLQEDSRRCSCGARCCRCCSRPGHPWITFKDPCNVRSPAAARRRGAQLQPVHRDHAQHQRRTRSRCATWARSTWPRTSMMRRRAGSRASCKRTIRTAMRMLDNVIDINYYAVDEGAQLQPAPPSGGPGHHGLPGCLHMMRIPYASHEAVEFADRSMEAVAITPTGRRPSWPRSAAATRSYRGSLWDRGILPQDTLELLAEERGGYVEVDRSATLDWDAAARAHQAARHAQLQLRGDRADRDHLQHRRRVGLHRADLSEPVRQVEPVGRVHRRSTNTWCAT